MTENRGVTLLELLVCLSITGILITMGITGFQALFERLEIDQGVREVLICLNHARYLAVRNGCRVRLDLFPGGIGLHMEEGGMWKKVQDISLDPDLEINTTGAPCFYPEGYIIPLFTITVENRRLRYRITSSMAGRFKVREAWKF